jgi:hypothetical protein
MRTIIGIDADEIVSKYYGTGSESGQRYNEFILPERDIVMRVALNQDYSINETISDIRDEVYRLISSNRSGELSIRFFDGGGIARVITAVITKVEVAYFSDTPELQITFNCPDPIFRSIAPFDIPSADLGTTNKIVLVDASSTAPHGISFKVEFTAALSTFYLMDIPTTPNWVFQITPVGGFAIGDTLEISSEYGKQKVIIDPVSALSYEAMNLVTSASKWPQIFPGENILYINSPASIDWLSMSYYSAYWGL